MLRFLLTPRWIGLFLVVVVLGFVCVRLSHWQFGRYHERSVSNTTTRKNLAEPPVPASRLMRTSGEPAESVQYRRVTVTGHYDAGHQIAVLYQSRGGAPGVDVLVPLVTPSGTAVLVDRGWIPEAANGRLVPKLPAPPTGTVSVTGRVRIDSTDGSSVVTPSQGAVRAVSAAAIKRTLPYRTYDGFLDLTRETPSPPHAPAKAAPPSLSGGPSFFYGWQWLFFAGLFFAFYCYFAWSEYNQKRQAKPEPNTTAPPPPVTIND